MQPQREPVQRVNRAETVPVDEDIQDPFTFHVAQSQAPHLRDGRKVYCDDGDEC